MTNEIMKVEPAVITFDFPRAQEILDVMLEPWKGLTPEGAADLDIKTARASRAELNRMKKELEDARKAVKRAINEPYEVLNGQVKELVGTIDTYCNILDTAIKQKEQRYRDDRMAQMSQDYRDFAPMIAEIIPFEKILKPEWLNKTYGTRKAQNEMYEIVERIRDEYETLRDMEGTLEFYVEDKAVFFDTLSLKEALANENTRKQQAKAIAKLESDHAEYSGEKVEEHYYNLTVCCAPEVMRKFRERPDVAIVKFEEVSL